MKEYIYTILAVLAGLLIGIALYVGRLLLIKAVFVP